MRVLAIALLVGCYHPREVAGVPCAANGECPSGQSCDFTRSPPICIGPGGGDGGFDTIQMDAPLACVDNTACSAADPICDGTTHTCRGCVADTECAPGVCTEYNGECVVEELVVFVSPPPVGDNANPCTAAAPCATLDYALSQVTAARRVIRVGDGTYMRSGSSQINVSSGFVVYSGERLDYVGGATIKATSTSTANPPVAQINQGATVVIEGVSLSGNNDAVRYGGALTLSHVDIEGTNGDGITTNNTNNATSLSVLACRIANNKDTGISVQNGSVYVDRTIVYKNANDGLDISQPTSATIVNSIVAGNTGFGVRFMAAKNGVVPLVEFSTIAQNTQSPGVNCDNSGKVTVYESIVYGNGANAAPSLCSMASATYSLFSDVPIPPGIGNVGGDPAFVDAVNGDFHIGATSAARSQGDQQHATLAHDFDGEARPQNIYDIGADEIP